MRKLLLLSFSFIFSIIIVSGCEKKADYKISKQLNVKSNSQINSTDSPNNMSIGILESKIIKKTLSEVDSIKRVLLLKENEVKEKISNLAKTNPILANKDPFESSSDYLKRLPHQQPIINEIRNEYCNDLKNELYNLRNKLFESENVVIVLGVYNPDSQIYPIIFRHFDYQSDIFKANLRINNEIAKVLYNNWDSINKKVIHTIGLNDRIGLSQIIFSEPKNDFYFSHTFSQQILSVKCNENCAVEITSASFSPNGAMIAYYANTIMPCFNVYVYDLLQREYINYFVDSGYNPIIISFSTNNRYVISFDSKFFTYFTDEYPWYFISDPNDISDFLWAISVFDLKTNKQIKRCSRKNNNIYNSSGQYLCTISDNLTESSDSKFKLVRNQKSVEVFRLNIPKYSDTVKMLKKEINVNITKKDKNYQTSNNSYNSDNTTETEFDTYRKNKFLNSSVEEIDSRGTGLSKEEVNWLYEEAKKQGYCD